MDEMDWKAAMDSEIFREFAKNELKKKAAEEPEFDMDKFQSDIEDNSKTWEYLWAAFIAAKKEGDIETASKIKTLMRSFDDSRGFPHMSFYKEKSSSISSNEDLKRFAEMQETIRSTPKLLQAFKTLQRKFISDPEYTAKVKVAFVDAVMLLDLE